MASATPQVLVASSRFGFRSRIVSQVRAQNRAAEEVEGGAAALARLESGEARVVLLDCELPDLDASEVAGLMRQRFPDVLVHVVESDGDAGAESTHLLGRILQSLTPLKSEAQPPPDAAPRHFSLAEPLPGMTGASPQMQHVYRLARLVSPRDTTVLIQGETGTGKELVAQAIHSLSARARKPFVVVNCAAIPELLLESELFGYVRGAFTGALQSRLGRIHAAHGGTLFLDEVGELPLSMQAKLLRFLQDGEVQRLGSPDVFRVDVRVVAATNADLEKRTRDGRFRSDLFFRLCVFPLLVPPLRARPADIEPLAARFLREYCEQAVVPPRGIAAGTLQLLLRRGWPGNVRELKHTMERAFILSEEAQEICPEHLVPFFADSP
jgi:transcriptional regulator with GAF, ATPase, and Fis domain